MFRHSILVHLKPSALRHSTPGYLGLDGLVYTPTGLTIYGDKKKGSPFLVLYGDPLDSSFILDPALAQDIELFLLTGSGDYWGQMQYLGIHTYGIPGLVVKVTEKNAEIMALTLKTLQLAIEKIRDLAQSSEGAPTEIPLEMLKEKLAVVEVIKEFGSITENFQQSSSGIKKFYLEVLQVLKVEICELQADKEFCSDVLRALNAQIAQLQSKLFIAQQG